MEQPDYIEVRLHHDEQNPRDLSLPSSLCVGELKEQISLSKAMSNGSSIEANRILLWYKDESLSDEIVLSDLGAQLVIKISFLAPPGSFVDQKDALDLRNLADRLRELTREDLPATKQRHFIHEHHRKVSAAVINAMNRSRENRKCVPMVTEPILEEDLEESHVLIPGVYSELSAICEQLIDVLETSTPREFDAISQTVCDLTDCILSVASFVHIERDVNSHDICDDRDIGTILSEQPIDRRRFSSALISCMHDKLNGVCSSSSSASTLSEQLAHHIVDGSSAACIGKYIEDLVASCCNTISSPTRRSGERALLPNPTERAPLSPEIANWAKGLKPVRKLSRP
jgi:hypothetical protein